MSSPESYASLGALTLRQHNIQRYKAFTNYLSQKTQLYANNVFIRYYSSGIIKTLSYSDADRLAVNLACKWAADLQDAVVVSFIGDHSISYMITIMAIMKLRNTIFTISPRNSENASVDLMNKTGSKFLIANEKYKTIANRVVSKIPGAKLMTTCNFDMEAFLEEPLNPNYRQILDLEFSDDDAEKLSFIIHSSGSTSFPKPIYLSNRYLLSVIKTDIRTEIMGNEDVMLPIAPLFHLFGLISCFCVVEFGGSSVFLDKLSVSPAELHDALVANNVSVMTAPPIIYELMVPYLKQSKNLKAMQRLKLAAISSASIKFESGEWLHNNHINIRNLYGSSETGAMMLANCDPECKNWYSFAPILKSYAAFETNDPNEPDIKHLYLHAGYPALATNVANREDGGYNTHDLFTEDPDFPGYYNFIGRRDDILLLKNGEKTNPVPMEATIRDHPLVQQVAVLGNGRQCTAALIQLNRYVYEDYSPEEIIETVHEAVRKANLDCPTHSKILAQMIKILPLSKPLPCTDKHTIMRRKAESTYQDLVDKLYENLLDGHSSQSKTNTMNDSSVWTSGQIESFLVSCVAEILGVPCETLSDFSRSLFDLGLDSLTAIQLRNRIAEKFNDIGHNFLFLHPSIGSMRDALLTGKQQDASEQIEYSYNQTQKLAEDYIKKASKDFPRARNSYSSNSSKVALLTGATGSVGSFMLRALLQDPSVEKVYCCVRGEDHQLRDRLVKALESRLIDPSILNTDRVEILPMRFNQRFMGLTKKKYYQLKRKVTIVQHCAWLLDFNMPVDHFDKECIQSLYTILQFAYKKVNPMHVHFVSSVSASVALGAEITEAPLPFDSRVSSSTGYAQSKFIVEILFNYLIAEKNFPCYIERLGQVCGDSINGIWNASEQYPLMFIGGGAIMHQMPDLDTCIDWIPVDYAATSIVDIMLRTAYLPANVDRSVYHIVNPQRIMWTDVLAAMKSAGMKFEVVEPKIWVQNLAKDESNPAFRLMSFYKRNFGNFFQMPVWKTEQTVTLAPVMSKSPVLNASLFRNYLAHWKATGFYNPDI